VCGVVDGTGRWRANKNNDKYVPSAIESNSHESNTDVRARVPFVLVRSACRVRNNDNKVRFLPPAPFSALYSHRVRRARITILASPEQRDTLFGRLFDREIHVRLRSG